MSSSSAADLAVFPFELPALRGITALTDKRLAPRSGVRNSIRQKPEWMNLVASVVAYEETRVTYDNVRAGNLDTVVPLAFWVAIDRLQAVSEAMTSVFPEWKKDIEPDMEVYEDEGAIIHLCQSIVDAEARIAGDRKYVEWHGFHPGGWNPRLQPAVAASEVSTRCARPESNAVPATRGLPGMPSQAKPGHGRNRRAPTGSGITRDGFPFALFSMTNDPLQHAEDEPVLQGWHVERAKYAYRRSGETYQGRHLPKSDRHVRELRPCHATPSRRHSAGNVDYAH